jgi:hypothetical protein
MSKKLGVSKGPKAGGIISHGIGGTRNVIVMEAITMMMLVKTGKAKKVGSGIPGGDETFGGTADGRGVIIDINISVGQGEGMGLMTGDTKGGTRQRHTRDRSRWVRDGQTEIGRGTWARGALDGGRHWHLLIGRRGISELFQSMGRSMPARQPLRQPPVCKIGNCFGDGAKCGRGFDPSHGKRQGDSNKGELTRVSGKDNGEFRSRGGS